MAAKNPGGGGKSGDEPDTDSEPDECGAGEAFPLVAEVEDKPIERDEEEQREGAGEIFPGALVCGWFCARGRACSAGSLTPNRYRNLGRFNLLFNATKRRCQSRQVAA